MKTLTNAILLVLILFVLDSCKKPKSSEQQVVPISPSELTVTLVSNTQAILNWVDKSTNEAGFKVERKTGNGTFGVIATTGADITTINDAGLTPNTTYTYRVYSFNNTGKSLSYTNEVTITTISLATVTTAAISDTTGVSAVSGGNITNDGGSAITARGVVWGTNPAPIVSLTTKTTDGSGSGQFNSRMEGLSKSTKYYVRAYATNAAGTAYGNELSFTTNTIDLNSGLVAYYPFNGNANDESGNGNNGNVVSATLGSDRFTKNNSAYVFNGSNTSIDIPNRFFNNGWNEYTISLWFYPTADVSATGPGQTFLNTFPHRGLGIGYSYSNSKKVYFFNQRDPSIAQNNWDIHNYSVNYQVALRTWIHYVLIKKGLNFEFYINGNLVGSTSYLSAPLSFLFSIKIGAITCCNPEVFNGSLDDLRFYNRALSDAEINYLSKN